MATGQYANVTVRATDNVGDHAVLQVEVEEHPQVRQVLINGLEHIKPEAVRDTTGLQAGEPYSPQEVQAAESLDPDGAVEEGDPFADIEDAAPARRRLINVVDIVMDVTEGNRVTIADVTVEGNERLRRGRIVGAMGRSRRGSSGSSRARTTRPARRGPAHDDPERLSRARYLDFRCSGHDHRGPEHREGAARAAVDEGAQYRIGELRDRGERGVPDTRADRYFQGERRGLLAGIGLGGGAANAEAGRVFDQVAFEAAAQQVRDLYANEGYLYAQVVPQVRKNPVVPGQPPTVDVSWDIREGLPAYIRRVAVVGNDYTYDWVVRDRLLLLPGDRYSQQRIIQSYQSIGSLGFFETPLAAPNIVPDPETGDVDVTFVVKEKQTGSVTFGSSVGGGVGLSGFVGYEQPNLFGQAKSGHLRWDFGRYLNNFELSFSDPALLQSPISGSISVFNSRDRFFQFSTGRRKRVGASLNFGVPRPGHDADAALRGLLHRPHRLRAVQRRGRYVSVRPAGRHAEHAAALDHAQHTEPPALPVDRLALSLNSEFNGGVLGGSGDFSKHLFEGTWWVPIGQIGGGGTTGQGPRLALGLSVHGGAILGDPSLFPFDRFWMGGVQFGQQLRGYDETTITPFGYFQEGANGTPGRRAPGGRVPPADRRIRSAHQRQHLRVDVLRRGVTCGRSRRTSIPPGSSGARGSASSW
jgi:outer membrane protein insertion porin family